MARTFADIAKYLSAGTAGNYTTGDFSACASIQIPTLGDSCVFWKGNYNNSGWHAFVIPAGGILLRTNQLGTNQITTAANGTIAAGSRYVVVFTRSGVTVRIFVNGVEASYANQGTHGHPATASGNDFLIGAYNAAEYSFAGDIAEVALWSCQLSDSEAAAISKGFCPLLVRPASLDNYWPIIGRVSPEPDLMGLNPATLVGTPAVADHPRIIYPARRRVWPVAAPPAGTLKSLDGIVRASLKSWNGVAISSLKSIDGLTT